MMTAYEYELLVEVERLNALVDELLLTVYEYSSAYLELLRYTVPLINASEDK